MHGVVRAHGVDDRAQIGGKLVEAIRLPLRGLARATGAADVIGHDVVAA